MYRILLRNASKNTFQRTLSNSNHHRRFISQNNLGLRQAGFGKIFIILTPVAVVGGTAAYAKYDNEFRQTLVKNVPGSDTILKIVLQEENPLDKINKKFEDLTSSVTNLFGSSDKKDVKETAKQDKTDEKRSNVQQTKMTQTHSSKHDDSATKTKDETKISKSSEPAAKPAVVITSQKADVIPTEINELEKVVEVSAAVAVQEYNKAIKVLNSFNDDVKKIIDQAIENADISSWTLLKNKTGARDTAVELAEKAARDAIQKIEKCEVALSKVASTISHEKLETVRKKLSTVNNHINNVKDELYRAKDSANLSEKYWRKVESARNYFIDEIASIFPGLNLSENKLNLSKDDLDLFILHAFSHVLAYQKELQRLQIDGELRLKRAIEALRGEDQNEAVKAQLEYHLEKERRALAIENQKKIFQIKANTEKLLKEQLKKQAEAHVDHIKDALSQRESELRRTFMRELDEKMSTEKAAYKLQLASMVGKLKGMDAALKARAESEKCANQAQSLWAACQALWASVRTGEPGVHWEKKLRPLKSEIKAVCKAAAEGDELVAVVLDNLPKEVSERGVFPEDALRERFINVERVARRLALVPEEGAKLPIYILSYLQSLLILRSDEPISREELENKIVDFSNLDTYDILNRAKYFLDRGDLTQSLKYMNLLQGAPRKVARDWLKEARLLLETQQAANTLMAHAAASGLLYL